MSMTLGLDVGASSLGWALVDEEGKSIIDMGVRVFPEGVNDMDTSNEASKNATRREKRQIRRMIMRRRRRKASLMRALLEKGLLSISNEDFAKIDPYSARRNALYGKIELDEFARAIYHIGQRRGFLSNRKTAGDDEDEEKGAIYQGGKESATTGISELQEEIGKGGHQTLGEYLYELDPREKRRRNRYTLRKMYIDEFNIIWEKQAYYYPDILTEENQAFFRDDIIFYQRPLKSQKHLVGKCKFEKDKSRARKASFEYQEFRMLQQVNSLIIRGERRIDDETQQLTHEERARLLDYLYQHGTLKIEDEIKSTFKKTLGLGKTGKYYCNLGHQKKLDGLKTVYSFKKAIKNWDDKSDEVKHEMLNTLYFAEDSDWLIEHAKNKWGLSIEEAKSYSKIALEKDYGSLSIKAIKKMLPFMRDGDLYNEAAAKVGYDHSLYDEKIKQTEFLEDPEWVANPIVRTSLYEIKRVVNALIERYGNPDTIRVELARELKLPLQKRTEILSSNKRREAKAKEIKEILLKEFNIDYPSRDDIVRYKLWEECNQTCPYTGRKIALNQLFGDMPEFEIEHIIPYSRSLDNSYMNKSLCWKKENARKSNKTPYELYSNEDVLYTEVKERIKNFPLSKARRFLQKEMDKDFISRQLNDTRYIARVSQHYLKHITADVTVGNGTITSYLRRIWKLNSTYKNPFLMNDADGGAAKNRKDHRHHSIDAIVVALTTRSVLQRLSTDFQKNAIIDADGNVLNSAENIFQNIKINSPWDNFRDDVSYHAARIIISHKCNKRVSGALHEETNYGKVLNQDGSNMINEKGKQLFAIRKKLEALTANEVMQIADPHVRQLVLERCIERGAVFEEKKNKLKLIPKGAFIEPLYLPSPRKGNPNRINKVRIRKPFGNSIQIRDYNIWAEPGNNHHAIIYTDENGKQKGKIVTLYEASQRKREGKEVIDTTLAPNEEFIMSIQPNEMFLFKHEGISQMDLDDKCIYPVLFEKVFRLQKMTDGSTTFRNHSIAKLESLKYDDRTKIRYYPGRKIKGIGAVNCRKIEVSSIGYIKFIE